MEFIIIISAFSIQINRLPDTGLDKTKKRETIGYKIEFSFIAFYTKLLQISHKLVSFLVPIIAQSRTFREGRTDL
jgi:hypothetical protein